MRIPKRVNAAWDWAESHGRVMALVFLLPILAVGALWSPVLAAFALGAAGGGMVTYTRLSKRITRLRGEVDDLLRECGRLRHRNNMLASGIVQNDVMVTQKLLSIPELREYEAEDLGDERRSA
ncbi:hypothetical protein SAMN04489712_102365 [Thermomonospora echinospora]|uniref:Uncharacterized protein n=1 Tax=Thermomonospora echinospora TaxID=1992 RepID=A0A1H5VLZ5_9ACTN|nr:hypothetical protein [Thermomonospora echinospora]SEF88046.1 hypothetical protein SAMN04489712_102365 [Thermomonospora echinospora]